MIVRHHQTYDAIHLLLLRLYEKIATYWLNVNVTSIKLKT